MIKQTHDAASRSKGRPRHRTHRRRSSARFFRPFRKTQRKYLEAGYDIFPPSPSQITPMHSGSPTAMLNSHSEQKKKIKFYVTNTAHFLTVMRSITTFRSTTDRIYDYIHYNIIIITIVVQLPTVFNRVICCTGL